MKRVGATSSEERRRRDALPVILNLTASPCFGGPERQMLGLARELRNEFDFHFATFQEEGRCWDFVNNAQKEFHNVHVINCDFPRVRQTIKELSKLLVSAKPALVMVHGYKAGILGRFACRRHHVPVVAVSRGWTGESLRVRLFESIEKWHLRLMDRVICVSESQTQKVLACGVHRAKVQCIPNAIDVNRFQSQTASARRELMNFFPNFKPQFVIGAAGRLSPEKGFETAIEAARQVCSNAPEAGFVLFGEGPLHNQLAEKISALGLQGRFVLAGHRGDLDAFFPHFDLFMQSSYTEGLPNVILEALAANVPVVATDVGGTSEIVETGITGILVPPHSSNELANAILNLISDGTMRREIAARGSAHVSNAFGFRKQADMYKSIFLEFIDQVDVG